MQCADVARLLSEGHSPAALRVHSGSVDHIANCPRCSQLIEWASLPLADIPLSEPLAGRIRSIVQTDLVSQRPLPALRFVLPGAFAVTCLTAALLYPLFGARGWQTLAPLQLILLTALAALVLAAATCSLFASIHPAAKQKVHPLAPILLHAAGFPLLAGLLFPAKPNGHFFEEGIVCLSVGLAVTAVSAGITLHFVRRGYSTDACRTGSLIGAVAGVAGSVGLQIACPDHEFTHMALWHGLVIVIPIAAGFLAGRFRALPHPAR